MPAKVMLEYLSLALLPTPEPGLLSAYAFCCTRVDAYPLGERPEAILSGLLEQGLVLRESGGVICRPDIREDVVADAIRAGRAAPLAKFCQERKIRSRFRTLSARERLQAVRISLYMAIDSESALERLIGTFRAQPDMVAKIGLTFVDPTSLDAFPRKVAFYIASHTLERGVYEGWDAPVARAWLTSLADDLESPSELVHGLVQTLEILRGDVAVHEALLQNGTPVARCIAAACLGLPVAEFVDVTMSRIPWPFQRLILAGCLSSLGESDRVKDLSVREEQIADRFESDLIQMFWRAGDLKSFDIESFMQEFGWSPDWSPGRQVATALVWTWLGLHDELPLLEESLEEAETRYKDSGYHHLARVLREMLDRLRDEEPQPCSLLDLARSAPQWERNLEDLSHWVARRKDPYVGMRAGDERIVWSVERRGSRLQVEPKIQKVKQNGCWSSGRAVRLLSTAHNPPDFADDQDRRALRAAAGADATDSWDRESEDEAALLELVGHPRVVFADKETIRSISVVRGRPRLRIKKKGEDLYLRIEPEPGKRARVKVVADFDRLTLYFLTREQTELAHLLGQGWLVVPREREVDVRAIAKAATGLNIVLDSDLRIGDDEVTVPAVTTLRLRLAPEGGGLSGRVLVRPLGDWGPFFEPGKGGRTLTAEQNGAIHHAVRDLKAEKAALRSIKQSLPDFAPTFRIDTPLQSLEFLEALQEHLGPGLVVEWPEGETFQLVGEAKSLSQLALSVTPEQNWFALDGSLTLGDDEVVSLQQLLQLAGENEGRFLPLGDNKYLALTQEFRARLDQLKLLTEKGGKGPLKANAFMATIAFPDLLPSDGPWAQKRQLLEQSQGLNPKLPKGLTADLRGYQKEGYTWMSRLAHWQAGACLADDMGLGKTVQALAMLLKRAALGPALVVAPTSVCDNWTQEGERFAPSLIFRTLSDGDRALTLADLGPGHVVLCSYGLMVNEIEQLQPVTWSSVVLDEAQYIKNSTTQRFKAAVSLQADFRLATTGTPIENHLEELWSLFAFLNPGLLGSRSSFVARFVRPIGAGDKGVKETLRRLVHPFILRRGKHEVLTELPAKTEIVHTVELSSQEMALYESLRREAVDSVAKSGGKLFTVLTSLMKLRRACCHPRLVLPGTDMPGSKLEAFSELVDELRSGGHRALVFSQFVDHLSIVRAHLDTRGIDYRYLDGATPARKRRDEVTAFQAGQGELFLISLRAGGVGLNLTAADYVIHLDPWWNPAVEDQASDRAHRMGQTRPVTVYRLVTAKTIEQKIVAMHAEKRDLAEKLLEGTDTATKLDVNELMSLLTMSGT